jgi:replicative DNA helicase
MSDIDPYNADAERSVVGAIICAACLDLDAGHRVLDTVYATGLEPHDFALDSLGKLYAAIVKQRVAGLPLDPVSLADALDQDGGPIHERARLEQLAHEAIGFTQAKHWAHIVLRDSRRRRFGG